MTTVVFNFPKVAAPHQQVICSPKLVATFSSPTDIPQEGEILTFAFDIKLSVKEISIGSALFGEVYVDKPMVVTARVRHFSRDSNSKMNQLITITLATSL